jgi:hypothetical protein
MEALTLEFLVPVKFEGSKVFAGDIVGIVRGDCEALGTSNGGYLADDDVACDGDSDGFVIATWGSASLVEVRRRCSLDLRVLGETDNEEIGESLARWTAKHLEERLSKQRDRWRAH